MARPPPDAPPALPLANYYWVLPGQLLAGEHPAGRNEATTRVRLSSLLAAGIGCFIDLTQEGECPSYQALLPPGTEYYRHPIPDHDVPADAALMRAILGRLRQALSAGGRVYLHCRAGIGRTGMTAGCLLAESCGGVAAIEELNHRWQGSARAASWESIPETDAQTEFVRRWQAVADESDPLLSPETLAAARALRERYLGALVGAAVGDAVAAATQYRRPGKFTPVGDMLGGGPFELPRGAWSDDTAMALCLAESLLARGGFDARDQVERYRRWQQDGHLSATQQCVGITAGTARALARAQWRRQPFSGSHDPGALDPETLSRVAPVVLFFFADAEQAVTQAGEAARTTCQSPPVIGACRALARALHLAVSGAARPAILAAGAAGAAPGGEGSAPQVLGAALKVFEQTTNFREAVLAAANLGGTSDVAAAVCGALAGAHYTYSSIPAMWRNSLMRLPLIEGFADQLLAHALVELAA
ncbi:MAG: ADP-ribosylglycohydrolase family protein [Proteobacteria bacterium]|nr:ADP-ribosylglycohydrolase family protein [Pseudomonadota bacterium]